MKVADLTGVLLDFWVARTARLDAVISDLFPNGARAVLLHYGEDECGKLFAGREFSPSTNGGDADPLIEQHWIGVNRPSKGQKTPLWCAIADNAAPRRGAQLYQPVVAQWGETHRIAAMRCFVAMYHGEEVPDVTLTTALAA